MQPVIIYCFDPYCSWCFGFSPVVKAFSAALGEQFNFEVLPGGMIMPKKSTPISTMAEYLVKTYKEVENATGVLFGDDYLWHIKNPQESDWYPSSEKPAIALAVFKEYFPKKQIEFATDMQYALFAEGRDLCDDEAYRHLLLKYEIPAQPFYEKMQNAKYKEEAFSDFETVKRLQVNGYPCLLLQLKESKFYLISNGYADYNTLIEKIKSILEEIKFDKI